MIKQGARAEAKKLRYMGKGALDMLRNMLLSHLWMFGSKTDSGNLNYVLLLS